MSKPASSNTPFLEICFEFWSSRGSRGGAPPLRYVSSCRIRQYRALDLIPSIVIVSAVASHKKPSGFRDVPPCRDYRFLPPSLSAVLTYQISSRRLMRYPFESEVPPFSSNAISNCCRPYRQCMIQ